MLPLLHPTLAASSDGLRFEHGLTMLLERLAVQDLREDVRRVLLGPEVLKGQM